MKFLQVVIHWSNPTLGLTLLKCYTSGLLFTYWFSARLLSEQPVDFFMGKLHFDGSPLQFSTVVSQLLSCNKLISDIWRFYQFCPKATIPAPKSLFGISEYYMEWNLVILCGIIRHCFNVYGKTSKHDRASFMDFQVLNLWPWDNCLNFQRLEHNC